MSGRRTGFLVGFFGALVLVATPAAGSRPAGAAILDPVTLNLWPSGQGKIEATPAGGSTTTCDYTDDSHEREPLPGHSREGRERHGQGHGRARLDASVQLRPLEPAGV